MAVMGLDPGLTRTGFGLVEAGNPPQLLAVGVLTTDPDQEVPQRLVSLWNQTTELLEEHRPDQVAIEQIFTNRNLQTALAVVRASGVLMATAAQQGIPVTEFSPTSVKSAVAGDGRATKPMMAKMVQTRLRLSSRPRPADAVDAVAVALCHLQTAPFHRTKSIQSNNRRSVISPYNRTSQSQKPKPTSTGSPNRTRR